MCMTCKNIIFRKITQSKKVFSCGQNGQNWCLAVKKKKQLDVQRSQEAKGWANLSQFLCALITCPPRFNEDPPLET